MTGVYANTTKIADGSDPTVNGIDAADVRPAINALDTVLASMRFAGGRLSLSNTLPVPSADVTTTNWLYYLPYAGANGAGLISLWDANKQGIVTVDFTGAAVYYDLSALPAFTVYDVFGYLSGGALVLELSAWASSAVGTATRLTGLTWYNGLLCKDGDPTRRILGTIRTTSAGASDDIAARRNLANAYNQVPRRLRVADSTASWTWNSATYRTSGGDASNLVYFTVCLDGAYLHAHFAQSVGGTTITAGIALEVDSYFPSYVTRRDGSGIMALTADYDLQQTAGFHFLAPLESAASGTATFYGNGVLHLVEGYIMA